MPVFRVSKNKIEFPDPTLARDDGLLAVGGDLSVSRLLLAYVQGCAEQGFCIHHAQVPHEKGV